MARSPGVQQVHDLHVWTITSGFPALAAHVLVDRDTDCHATRRELEAMLRERFGLDHTTLQVDHEGGELLQIDVNPGGGRVRTAALRQPGGEAERVDLDPGLASRRSRWRLVARVHGEVVEARGGHLDRPRGRRRRARRGARPRRRPRRARRPAAYSSSSASPSSAARHGSVTEPPGSSSSLGGATSAPGASVGRAAARSGAGGSKPGVERHQLLGDRALGRLVLALAEVKPAQRARPGPRGTATASPRSRSRARPRRRSRRRPGGGRRAARAPARALALAGEPEAGRVDARGSPGRRRGSARSQAIDVGERADAVELGEVEEVDQHRAGGGELGDHRVTLGARGRPPGAASAAAAAAPGRRCCRGAGARGRGSYSRPRRPTATPVMLIAPVGSSLRKGSSA